MPQTAETERRPDVDTADWVSEFRERVAAELTTFLSARKAEIAEIATGADEQIDLAVDFVAGGKYLRSTFAYLGWLSGADESTAAVRAAASLELLHAFALIQDDVMDGSAQRRGRPSVHREFAAKHRRDDLGGDSGRFGESAAVLLGDLCLVWSEQLLRTSGLPGVHLERAWECYDSMRQELAVGQYLDLLNTSRRESGFDHALEVANLKSARYTVTRPLMLGAYLANAADASREALTTYGESIGEAFQLRDDVLGIFGDPAVTGKPAGEDLREGKATTIVALSLEIADTGRRGELRNLLERAPAEPAIIERIRTLIVEVGALDRIETRIADRVHSSLRAVDTTSIPAQVRTALLRLARECANRSR